MPDKYGLIAIGTGVAAQVVAMRARAAGWSVAVIDFRPFGGTCALRGCDPKKALVGVAAAADGALRMRGKGLAGEAGILWPQLMAFKRGFTDPVPEAQMRRYAEQGIDTYRGHARFTGLNSVEVDGRRLEAEHILVAVGAAPVELGIPGEEYLATSEDFLSLQALPGRIVFVGGGYIASEFAHVAARAGAEVTVVQRAERLLTRFDPDLVGWLTEKFREIGVNVLARTSVVAIEEADGELRVHAESGGRALEIHADLVVHAAGRAPALAALAPEAAGIEVENGRLKLNEYLQSTTNPAVYAAGDAAQLGPPLTPVSSHDAKVVAANLLEGNRRKPDYRAIPSVAFTIPPIAAVGISEAEARGRGLALRIHCRRTSDWYTARRAAETVAGFKVLVDAESDHLLGAHLLGPHAEEVINVFALAMRYELMSKDLKAMMFAYPTAVSDIVYML